MGDIIIGFTDLNPVLDTVLTNQYASRGVTFSPPLPLIFSPGAGGSTHFLVKSIFAGGSLLDRSSHEITGTFTDSRHSLVLVRVGRLPANFEAQINLRVYDVSRNMLGSTLITVPAATSFTLGEILVSNPSISFFVLERIGNATADFYMTSLEFDDPSVRHPPDFRLQYTGGDRFLKPGAELALQVKVLRLYGSSGDIQIAATGGPPGLAVTNVAPDIINGGNDDTTNITILINGNAQEAQASPAIALNVHGVPDSTSGVSDRTTQILVNILESYDLQILGMEITQGIQNFDLPTKTSPDLSGIVTYDGFNLAANCRTTVKVFPSFRSLPSGPLRPSFEMRLSGFTSAGVPLPGPWISPDQLPATLSSGNAVTPTIRTLSAARFTLPPSWTHGSINLEAEVFDTSGSNAITPALTFETNPNNNSFSTNGITFFNTENLYIRPVPLLINDVTQPGSASASLAAPQIVFSAVKQLFPIDAGKLVILPYQATLNVTTAFQSTTTPQGRAEAIKNALLDFADSNGWVESERSFTVGVFSTAFFGNFPTRVSGMAGDFPQTPGIFSHFSEVAAIVQDTGRPLTVVAHEVSHLCGRIHASAASLSSGVIIPTGAQAPFESWPPDQLGFLQGVGFNNATSNVIYPQRFNHPETAGFQRFFDYMSYAANPNDSDAWLSPRGGEETLEFLRPYRETHPNEPQDLLASKTSRIPLAAIVRFKMAGEAQNPTIVKVGPVENLAKRTGTESSYNVILKAYNQKDIVAQGHPFVLGQNGHHGIPFLQANLQIETWDAIGSVEIYRDSALISKLIRPAAAALIADLSTILSTNESSPLLSSQGPHREISWTCTHPLSLPLSARILYLNPSEPSNTPAAWKDIYYTTHLSSCPDPHSSISKYTTGPLPASHFPHNPAAQVSLVVSDGFNITSAISVPFSSLGSKPEVHISIPRAAERLKAGCSVYLHAEAYDDWGHKIVHPKNLSWIVNGKVVAEGALTSWRSGMDEFGPKTLRAEATDYMGRKNAAQVEIELFK